MISGIGYAQGLVSRPVGVVDATARTILRRFGQTSTEIAGAFGQRQAGLSLGEGRIALSDAVSAADSVVEQLTALKEKVAIARGLGSPSIRGDTNLYQLQAEADQLTRGIDSSVASAGRSGFNLIGSPSENVRISSPNGTVAVTVQPLSARDLGVSSLDLSTSQGVDAALSSLQSAISTATARRELLASVSDELGNTSTFTAQLASSLRGLSYRATGRDLGVGSALDIRA